MRRVCSPRAAPSLTLTIPEDGVVHELRGVPVTTGTCAPEQTISARATGADDLERAFTDVSVKRSKGDGSQNGLLPSMPAAP